MIIVVSVKHIPIRNLPPRRTTRGSSAPASPASWTRATSSASKPPSSSRAARGRGHARFDGPAQGARSHHPRPIDGRRWGGPHLRRWARGGGRAHHGPGSRRGDRPPALRPRRGRGGATEASPISVSPQTRLQSDDHLTDVAGRVSAKSDATLMSNAVDLVDTSRARTAIFGGSTFVDVALEGTPKSSL